MTSSQELTGGGDPVPIRRLALEAALLAVSDLQQHLAEAGEDASAYAVSKGTVRFPLGEPVPTRLVQRLVKLRAQEASARAKKKVAKQRPAKK